MPNPPYNRHHQHLRDETLNTQGPSWGCLKVNSSETLSIFGDKCPQNGSKNDLQERPNGSKNDHGMPPRRASRGLNPNQFHRIIVHPQRVGRAQAILKGAGIS